MTVKYVDYLGFAGGTNSDLMPDAMADNEARQIDNFDIKSKGWETRDGCEKINTAAYTASTTQLLTWHSPSGNTIELAVNGKNLCVINANGTKTIKQALASDKIGYATFLNGVLYFVDGDKYRTFGMFNYDTDVAGTAATTLLATDVVRNIPISTHSTTPGVAGHYYMPKTTGSYTLSSADYGNTANWTDVTDTTGTYCDRVVEVIADSDGTNLLGRISKCTMLAYHPTSNRMFAAGNPNYPSAMFWSEVGKPNFFKAVSKNNPAGNLGYVKGLMAVSQSMVVSYTNGFMVWNGITPSMDDTSATWKAMPIPVGPVSRDAMCMVYNGIAFMSQRGFHIMSTSLLGENNNVLPPSTDYFMDVAENRVTNILIDGLVNTNNVQMVFHQGKVYIAYAHCDYDTLSGVVDIQKGDIVRNYPLSMHVSAAGTVNCYYQATKDMLDKDLATADYGSTANWTLGSGTFPAKTSDNLVNNRVLVFNQGDDNFVRYTGWQVDCWLSTDGGDLVFGSKGYILLQSENAMNDINVDDGAAQAIWQAIRTKPYSPGGDSTNHYRTNITGLFITAGQRAEPITSKVQISLASGYKKRVFADVDFAESFMWGRKWGLRWGWTDFLLKEARVSSDSYRHEVIITSKELSNPLSIYSIGFSYEETASRGTQMADDTNFLT